MAKAAKLVNSFFQSLLDFVETSQMARANRIVSELEKRERSKSTMQYMAIELLNLMAA